MTQEELEGNKLIALWQGATITKCDVGHSSQIGKELFYPVYNGITEFHKKLKYHKSMDWLYPVYQKICKCIDSNNFNDYFDLVFQLDICAERISIGEDVSEIFKEIVEWIKIYNLKVLEDGNSTKKS